MTPGSDSLVVAMATIAVPIIAALVGGLTRAAMGQPRTVTFTHESGVVVNISLRELPTVPPGFALATGALAINFLVVVGDVAGLVPLGKAATLPIPGVVEFPDGFFALIIAVSLVVLMLLWGRSYLWAAWSARVLRQNGGNDVSLASYSVEQRMLVIGISALFILLLLGTFALTALPLIN